MSGIDQVVDWPEGGLEYVDRCPVCGGNICSLLYAGLTDKIFGVARGRWNLYSCGVCGSAYLNPRPNAATISQAYTSYYTHEQSSSLVVRRIGRLRTILHDLLNDYMNDRFGMRRHPASRWGRWLVPLCPPLKAAADSECRHLFRQPNKAGGLLLDIGCGNGDFLALARDMGWQVEGVDFDPKAVEVAQSRGLNVRQGGIELLENISDKYDVITLSHVIEHVHAPIDLLQSIYRMLKPGGMLWLETPNVRSLGHRKYKENWRGIEPPRHLVLFNCEILKCLLTRIGFTKIRQYWHGMSVFTIYAASDALVQGLPAVGIRRASIPPLGDMKDELREMLAPERREFIAMTAQKSE